MAAALAAGATAMALVMSGCAVTADDAVDREVTAGLIEGVESEWQAGAFPDVYAQHLDWGGCDEEFALTDEVAEQIIDGGGSPEHFECAWVLAPLDWNDTESDEVIELAVTRIPAHGSGEPLGALLGNPGGPGESGLEYAYFQSVAEGFEEVAENYDVIGFDPRGIGMSSPLQCEAGGDDYLESDLSECVENDPLALSMGTSQVARDMELLRVLLGDDWFNYLGYSYGTMLGATYSTLFPERVGRMVLDSASASDWASPGSNFDQQVAFAQQLAAMIEGCGAQGEADSCPFVSEAEYLAEIDALNKTPIEASGGIELTGEELRGYLENALYEGESGRADALATVASALRGDSVAIDEIMGIAEDMDEGDEPDDGAEPERADLGLDGIVVSCHSFPTDFDLEAFAARVDAVGVPESLGGAAARDEIVDEMTNSECGVLPVSGDEPEVFSGSPDAPMLVIALTGDHATPYAEAQKLVDELGNAVLLTLDAAGHAASYTGRSGCVDDAATEFLLTGELPVPGTVCQVD